MDKAHSNAHMTADQFRAAGHAMVDWIAEYLATVESRPVQAGVSPGQIYSGLPASAPELGEAWEGVWSDFERLIMPGVTHWQHPGFAAFFPCNNSGPAILGELLSAGLGINGFLWQCSPAITELEMRVTDWLGRLIGLPDSFLFGEAGARASGGGVIHGTASEAVLTALVAARARAFADGGAAPRLVAYTSSQAHSSVMKAAMVSGLGRENLHVVEVDPTLAMDAAELGRRVRQDRAGGRTPFFVCATVGTTSTGAIDPIRTIGEIARDHGMWMHVDAAYAGAACICPEHRAMIDGVELADSFNFNPHKWLLTNFDCSAFWVRDRAALTAALSITPAYLRNKASESGDVVDYRDWQVPLGRRFRALKLWFVLRHYGAEGLRRYIREHIRLAEVFEGLVRGDQRFELPTPRCLSLVCFRLRGTDEANRRLLERINASGRVWLIGTTVPVGEAGADQFVLRMAIGSTGVQERHIRGTWEVIARAAGEI
jgi:aromatic-L-amino-acid decarboxylase